MRSSTFAAGYALLPDKLEDSQDLTNDFQKPYLTSRAHDKFACRKFHKAFFVILLALSSGILGYYWGVRSSRDTNFLEPPPPAKEPSHHPISTPALSTHYSDLSPDLNASIGPIPRLPDPDIFGNYLDHLEPSELARYVTAIPLGGINNQMVGTLNLISLANLSSRSVILPPIIPNEHQPGPLKGRSYSDYYDLNRLSSVLRLEILEWNRLRNEVPSYQTGEYAWTETNWKLASNPLTCWPAAKMGSLPEDDGRPITSRFGRGLMLDVQMVYAPDDQTKGGWRSMDAAVKFLRRNTSIINHHLTKKDVACISESYWLDAPNTAQNTQYLIKHLRFSEKLEATVDRMISQILGFQGNKLKKPLAPFITVHLRRNDIGAKCNPVPKNWKELAPKKFHPTRHSKRQFEEDGGLSLVTRGLLIKRKKDWRECNFLDSYIVSRVNTFRRAAGNFNIPVVLTTDDKNPDALRLFDSQKNWHRFDLAKLSLQAEYDGFDNVMIAACLLTRGKAFLGTGPSTMSRLAAQRGKLWYKRPFEKI